MYHSLLIVIIMVHGYFYGIMRLMFHVEPRTNQSNTICTVLTNLQSVVDLGFKSWSRSKQTYKVW
jgi:flagellar biogenesis protein FliO